MNVPRTLIGAALGALAAVIWIIFDTGAVFLLLALTATGAAIGATLENPAWLISLLQRIQDR